MITCLCNIQLFDYWIVIGDALALVELELYLEFVILNNWNQN